MAFDRGARRTPHLTSAHAPPPQLYYELRGSDSLAEKLIFMNGGSGLLARAACPRALLPQAGVGHCSHGMPTTPPPPAMPAPPPPRVHNRLQVRLAA